MQHNYNNMESIAKAIAFSTIHFGSGVIIASLTDSLFAGVSVSMADQFHGDLTANAKSSREVKVFDSLAVAALAALEAVAESVVIGGFTSAVTEMWSETEDPTGGIPYILALVMAVPHLSEKVSVLVNTIQYFAGIGKHDLPSLKLKSEPHQPQRVQGKNLYKNVGRNTNNRSVA